MDNILPPHKRQRKQRDLRDTLSRKSIIPKPYSPYKPVELTTHRGKAQKTLVIVDYGARELRFNSIRKFHLFYGQNVDDFRKTLEHGVLDPRGKSYFIIMIGIENVSRSTTPINFKNTVKNVVDKLAKTARDICNLEPRFLLVSLIATPKMDDEERRRVADFNEQLQLLAGFYRPVIKFINIFHRFWHTESKSPMKKYFSSDGGFNRKGTRMLADLINQKVKAIRFYD